MWVRMRRGRSGVWLLAAGLIGLLAAVLSLRAAAQGAPPDGRILVAGQALPAGLVLDEETAPAVLVVVPAPMAPGVRGVFADPVSVVGRRVSAPVGVGEPITEAALGGEPGSGPAPLAVGERSVAVPLSAAGGPEAGLVPGARVDVVASSGEGLAGTTALVVADAEVLAVTTSPGAGDVGAAGEAILRVSSRQALRVTAALNFAREVRLLARPADEGAGFAGPRQVTAP